MICAGLQENNNDDERILPQYIGILLITSHLGGDLAAWGSLAARGSLGLRPRDPLAARSLPSVLGRPLAWRDEQNPLPFGKMQAMYHCCDL